MKTTVLILAAIGIFIASTVLLNSDKLPDWSWRIAVIVLALSVALGGSALLGKIFNGAY